MSPKNSRRRVRPLKRVAQIASTTMLMTGVAAGLGAAAFIRRRRRKLDLAGKVVVITGGSRGLGYAMALECARLGATLVLCARNARELQSAKESLEQRYNTKVATCVCDVTVRDEVQTFVMAVIAQFGRIDLLINNAGVISVGPIGAQTVTDFQESMDVMFWGVVYPTLAVLPHMKARHQGRIANITSIGGKIAVPHLVPYCSAKFAAVGFSESMHAELLKDGIKVTTVSCALDLISMPTSEARIRKNSPGSVSLPLCQSSPSTLIVLRAKSSTPSGVAAPS